jgi:hypothetical protein
MQVVSPLMLFSNGRKLEPTASGMLGASYVMTKLVACQGEAGFCSIVFEFLERGLEAVHIGRSRNQYSLAILLSYTRPDWTKIVGTACISRLFSSVEESLREYTFHSTEP